MVLGHEDRLVALPQRGAYLRRDVHRRAQPHEGQAADGPPREVDAARTLGIVLLLELARLVRVRVTVRVRVKVRVKTSP